MGGLVPYLVRTEYADDPLFSEAKVIYTPEVVAFDTRFTAELAEVLGLQDAVIDRDPVELGRQFADALILPPSSDEAGDAPVFEEAPEAMQAQARLIYEQVLSEVPA